MRRRIAAGLLVGIAAAMAGCRHGGAASGDSSGAPVAADTARGIVEVVGSEPLTDVVLRPVGDAGAPLALRGGMLAQLRAVTGLEVVASGRRDGGRSVAGSPGGAATFVVERFLVRASDGLPADDGVLVARDGGWFLRAADGTERRLVDPPAALREHAGARVWVAGPRDATPLRFGVVAAR